MNARVAPEFSGHRDEATTPAIAIDRVTTIIGDQVVLYQLSLDIPANQVTVLMGPSGAGKSTLVKHIVGLLEPAGGSIRIGDHDLWDTSGDDFRGIVRNIGAMLGGSSFFSASVFASLSVFGNLTATLAAVGVPPGIREERANAQLRELGMERVRNLLPGQLSGHDVKRLALGRALVLEAPITILDEIDVGLGHQHQQQLIDMIQVLRSRTDCSMLVTTHNVELARSLADNIAILVNGRIVASGPPATVLDGVHTSHDFERRFEFADYRGPARLSDALAVADRLRPPPPALARARRYARTIWTLALVAFAVLVAVIGFKMLIGQTN